MTPQADNALLDLKSQLLAMGGLVERAIASAVECLLTGTEGASDRVSELEGRINQSHKNVDEACVRLLALKHPLATDLRFVVASIKINTDLERMGDQAVNIVENAARMANLSSRDVPAEIKEMCECVRAMVREALDSFVRRDQTLARRVLLRDYRVDELKDEVFRTLEDLMRRVPELVGESLNLVMVARNLERIGDHASNIAENVVFVISGEDIRHAAVPAATRDALR
jgi:phosphate transport system protein